MIDNDLDLYVAAYDTVILRNTGRHPSQQTLRTKRHHVRAAARTLGCPSLRSLATAMADRTNVERLFEDLWARLQPSSIQSVYYAYSSFLEYAVRQGWIEQGKLHPDDRPRGCRTSDVSVYSPDDIDRLLTAASTRGDVRWWALVSFLALTGRRVGEARSLRWAWLRLDHEPPYFELPYQKNGKPQLIPLGTRMMGVLSPEHLTALRAPMPYSRRADTQTFLFPYAYSGVSRRFERLCREVGLPYRGLHNLRHSFITNHLIAGTPVQAVSALVGHSSPRVTIERYLHATAMNYRGFAL